MTGARIDWPEAQHVAPQSGCACPECCFARAQVHAARRAKGERKLPEAVQLTLPEKTLKALLIAARNAARELGEVAKLAGIKPNDIPELSKLTAAIYYAEKACGKRANEMGLKSR